MKQPLLTFHSGGKNKSVSVYIAFVFSILLLTSFPWQRASASHSAGGYLSYQWLHDSTYRFTVTFYKDCGGATPAPDKMELDFESSCGGSGSVLASQIAGTGQEIGYPCPNATTCSGGSNPGYRKFVYQVDVVFYISNPNVACNAWTVSFVPDPAGIPLQRLGRNNGITTLIPDCYDQYFNPVQCNLYTETLLDNKNFPTNSSVTFNNDPILFVCAGQSATFNLGASDPNGDSLYYELIPAKEDAYTNVTYQPPLSGTNPLFPVGCMSINHATGDVTINTNTIQIGVIAIRVKEYRNGVFVGSVIIDIQVVVQSCSNNYPSVSGVNGSASYADTVCPGTTISFNVISSDPDANQTLTMSWNNGIPFPATFTIAGSPHPTGTFSWTPTSADARPQPYTFTVTVTDNACPANGFQTHAYSIYVREPSVSISPSSTLICNGQSVPLTANGANLYTWGPASGLSSTSGATVNANPAVTTTYTVTGTDGSGCTATNTVVVTVNPLTPVAGPDTSICGGSTVQLSASGGSSYTWSPGTGLSSTTGSSVSANPSSSITYTVIVTNGNGCSGTATVSVNVSPLSPTVSPDTNICPGSSAQLTAAGGSFYSWSPATGLSSTTGATVSASPSASTIYTVTVLNSSGCSGTASVSVDVTPLSASAGPDTTVCPGSLVPLYASGGTNYSWQPGNLLVNPNSSNPSAYPFVPTTYTVTISTGNCSSTATVFVNVPPNIPTPTIIQHHDTLIVTTDPGYKSYQWHHNNQPIPNETDTFYIAPESGNYNVVVTDTNGCSISVGINIVLGVSVLNQAHGGIYISPNPVKNSFTVYGLQFTAVKMKIYNVLGQETSLSITLPKNGENALIEATKLPVGIYFLVVEGEKEKWAGKFVKE